MSPLVPIAQPTIPNLVDTHCHLDLQPLVDQLPAVLDRAGRAGVHRCVIPGVTAAAWPAIAACAREHPAILPAFGLHPLQAAACSEKVLADLTCFLPQAVAIGEIGLDYLLPGVDREQQRIAFRAQLRLAVAAGLPVLIHCRRAFNDLLTILREERVGRVGGIMHAFSGSAEVADACIRLGLLISISGSVTYHNAVRPVALVRTLPLESLVLETDAPDMTPEPWRGQDNEPAFIAETARAVATIKGVDMAVVAAVTTRNALRLLDRHGTTNDKHPGGAHVPSP
jgi:TatD DNase family protein